MEPSYRERGAEWVGSYAASQDEKALFEIRSALALVTKFALNAREFTEISGSAAVSIADAIKATADLVMRIHDANPEVAHLNLATTKEDCLVCEAVDRSRRASRLRPRLDRIEAVVNTDLARELPRHLILELMVEVERARETIHATRKQPPGGACPDHYAVAQVALVAHQAGADPRPSLSDVSRIARAMVNEEAGK